MQIINWAGAWGLVFMPRLESITVSHSLLSLTCDRNKAVLKATFSNAVRWAGFLSLWPPEWAVLLADCPQLMPDVHTHRTWYESDLLATANRWWLYACAWPVPGTAFPPTHPVHSALSTYFYSHFSSSRTVVLYYLYYTVNTKCMTWYYRL